MITPTWTYDRRLDAIAIRLTVRSVLEPGMQAYSFVNSAIEGAGPVTWGVSGDGHLVLVTLGMASRNVPSAALRQNCAELRIAWVADRPGQVFVPLLPDAHTRAVNRWPTEVPGLTAPVYTATAASGRIVGLAIDNASLLLEPDFLAAVVGLEPTVG